MTDLHAWTEQAITAVENAAKAATPGPWDTYPERSGCEDDVLEVRQVSEPIIALATVTDAHTADAIHIALHDPAAVLRRCAADRKILTRHNSWAATFPAAPPDRLFDLACHGCGTEGICDDAVTDNLNDCPELLDLAEGYGLTPDELERLDRPQRPELPQPDGHSLYDKLTTMFASPLPSTPMADVPPALRGPNWHGETP